MNSTHRFLAYAVALVVLSGFLLVALSLNTLSEIRDNNTLLEATIKNTENLMVARANEAPENAE